jgi:ubiquinone/menaquinone biosynthesis C-methylase UbiE
MRPQMELDHMDKVYNSGNPLVRYIHNNRLEIINALVGNNRERILDCGCGEGHLLAKINGIKYGVDFSKASLARAKERNPEATILEGNITNLPFYDDFFAITTCSEVLEHIPDYPRAISEIMRVTRCGGRIIISVPNERNWTIGRLATLRFPIKLEDHINSFKYCDLVKAFGFEPKRVIYIPLNFSYQLALTQVFEFEKPLVNR